MNPCPRLGVANPFGNLARVERIPRFAQDRPLDLSIGGALDAVVQCRPIDLRRRRRRRTAGTWVDRVPARDAVCRTWHHVRLNRSNEPLPFYLPRDTLVLEPPCRSFKETFILQKDSAPDADSITASSATAGALPPSKQNNLFGGSVHHSKCEKGMSSNVKFTSPISNPFKRTADASPEPPNKHILAPSKLSSFPNSNAGTNFVFGSSVMKPSSFSSLSAKPHQDTFTLKPSLLSNSLFTNPFKKAKIDINSEETPSSVEKTGTKNSEENEDNTEEQAEKLNKQEEEEDKASKEDTAEVIFEQKEVSPKDNAELSGEQTSLFVPLTNQSESMSSSDDSLLKPNGFSNTKGSCIFGQNMRPLGLEQLKGSSFFSATPGAASVSKSENLFSTAVSVLPVGHITQEGWSTGKSLVETSRELDEHNQNQKRKYEEVQVVTGEEDESNVIQMVCKLYSWTSGSWQERGRGILRLNDKAIKSEISSRLVVRTQGTLTIMLNTKVWSGMAVEKVNEKSVRFTACDTNGQPKIFLVMGTPKDVEILYTSLDYRIFETNQKKSQNTSKEEEEEEEKA